MGYPIYIYTYVPYMYPIYRKTMSFFFPKTKTEQKSAKVKAFVYDESNFPASTGPLQVANGEGFGLQHWWFGGLV